MKKNPVLLYKTLVVGVIVLFIGVGIQPAYATVHPEIKIDIEPKDYLFQTIIDIANNPDVKELFEQYNYDLFKVDIDKSIYRQILMRNPRLMFNTLLTKPSISIEYLNKCYNKGIEITNIIGEDKALEIMESIEITDTNVFNKLNNIIINNDELSGKLATLKEMDKKLKSDKPFENFPIICTILANIAAYSLFTMLGCLWIVEKFENLIVQIIFAILLTPIYLIGSLIFFPILFIIIFPLDCFGRLPLLTRTIF